MEKRGETYLVTGAAGFIGSRVAELLMNSGAQVCGADSINDAYDVRIKEHRVGHLKKNGRFSFSRLDIENAGALRELFENHEFAGVLNLAARAGVRYSMENPSAYLQTNAQGNLNLLELVRDFEVPKFVLASTSSLYAGHSLPFSEDMPVNEPVSSYAASKKAAESFCHAFHHLYGLDISIVRFFTVFGAAGRPDMCIFRFIKWISEEEPIQIYGDGRQRRDFTFVEDIARGTVAALKPLGHEIINLGGGMEPISLIEVIRMIEEFLGKKAKLEFHDAHIADLFESKAEISKAGRLLEWEPEISFEDGLKQTVDWYRKNRDWVRTLEL